jgi:hypothetical protein
LLGVFIDKIRYKYKVDSSIYKGWELIDDKIIFTADKGIEQNKVLDFDVRLNPFEVIELLNLIYDSPVKRTYTHGTNYLTIDYDQKRKET